MSEFFKNPMVFYVSAGIFVLLLLAWAMVRAGKKPR